MPLSEALSTNEAWTRIGVRSMTNSKLIFTCTHGKEDPERASLPFVAANVAATAGQEAIVLCTVEGVRLGTKGGTRGIESSGLPPLSKIYSDFVAGGGKVWLCGACTKPRGITEEQLAEGATIVGAAKIVEELAAGASSTSFA
jgi:predicted peroxiredoxin